MLDSIRQLLRDISRLRGSGAGMAELGEEAPDYRLARLRVLLQGIFTIIILATSVYILMDPNATEGALRFADGALGALVGYWLR